MIGLKRIRRIIKDTGVATYVEDGSTKPTWSSITLSQKEVEVLKQIEWITLGRPTIFVTDLKPRSTLMIPGWLPVTKVAWQIQSGKICGVCEGTLFHEDKCTNKILLLEGSNQPDPPKRRGL